MSDPLSETVQCRACGTVNAAERAFCENCNTPLTAYAGQLRGQSEEQRARLAGQITRLAVRPPGVAAMAIFDVLFALFWPLAFVIGGFAAREAVNREGTNYLSAAFGAIGPVLSAMVLIPVALALIGLAWATWTQHSWAWPANLGSLGLFALLALKNFGTFPIFALAWLIVAGALAFLWFKPEIKTWFGVSP